jgi:hypothetical protein
MIERWLYHVTATRRYEAKTRTKGLNDKLREAHRRSSTRQPVTLTDRRSLALRSCRLSTCPGPPRSPNSWWPQEVFERPGRRPRTLVVPPKPFHVAGS